jgi:D-alanine-D-alanine ligase
MIPRVAVLMGGPDQEREVSIASGTAVAEALRESGKVEVVEEVIERVEARYLKSLGVDVIFPVLHGPWGEGGGLQRELDVAGARYVGSSTAAAASAIDKDATKALAVQLGVPTPHWELLRPGDEPTFEGRTVVKPPREGSSIDLFLCDNLDACRARCHELLQRHATIMVEQFIDGREVTVGVVTGTCQPIIEIIPAVEFYDYDAKYNRDDTRYVLNPDIPDSIATACKEHAIRIGAAIGCRDLWRADFILDDRGPWFLELNTMPGFTSHSLLPKAAEAGGCSMAELCCTLVLEALGR